MVFEATPGEDREAQESFNEYRWKQRNFQLVLSSQALSESQGKGTKYKRSLEI